MVPSAQAAESGHPAWTPYRDIRPVTAQVAPVTEQPNSPPPLPMPRDVATAHAADYAADRISNRDVDSVTDSMLDELRTACRPAPCEPAMIPDTPAFEMPMMIDGMVLPQAADLWQWRVLPDDVIYHSYWAGAHEPRISGVLYNETQEGTAVLDVSLGGRVGLLRYGTADKPSTGRPQGWQLDMEGAAFPRLNLDASWDVDAVDFRFGLPLTYGRDNWQLKFSYYHLSSHMGDEFAIRTGKLGERINFSRDALVLGGSIYPLPAWRWYAEAGWAFHYDDGSQPWEFQFGIDYAQPGPTSMAGTPFMAINGHLREDVDYGGNMVLQAGWLWRGENDNAVRLGFHYFNGKSNQFQFFDEFEQQVGAGLWYDH